MRSRYQMLGPAQDAWRTHGLSALTSRLPRIFGGVGIALFPWYGWIARLVERHGHLSRQMGRGKHFFGVL